MRVFVTWIIIGVAFLIAPPLGFILLFAYLLAIYMSQPLN